MEASTDVSVELVLDEEREDNEIDESSDTTFATERPMEGRFNIDTGFGLGLKGRISTTSKASDFFFLIILSLLILVFVSALITVASGLGDSAISLRNVIWNICLFCESGVKCLKCEIKINKKTHIKLIRRTEADFLLSLCWTFVLKSFESLLSFCTLSFVFVLIDGWICKWVVFRHWEEH